MRLCAFTLTELLVLLAIFCILASMISVPSAGAKAKAKRIRCVNNLKNLGLSARIFATDNGDRFPWETNYAGAVNGMDEYLRSVLPLTNLASPSFLNCPADTRTPANTWKEFTRKNASYFIGLIAQQTFPQSIMAGDRNLTTNGVLLGPGRVELESGVRAVWDPKTLHRGQGNAVMGDGSVQQLSSARMTDQLRNTGLNTNVWLFP